MGTDAAENPQRRAGRPAIPVLTRERIAAAAVRRLQDTDPDHLRMADLADDLGVRPSSLYNHVRGRAELLNLVRDHLAGDFDTEALLRQPWTEALEAWARSYIASFARLHPSATAAIAVLDMGEQPTVMSMYERFCDLMLSVGWPDDQVMPTLLALESFCVGTAQELRAPHGYMRPTSPEATPTYNRLYRAGTEVSRQAADLGLSIFIAGLDQRLATILSTQGD